MRKGNRNTPLPALQRLTGAEVVALSDINIERLNTVADLFHVKTRYTDYRRLVENPSIDAVGVCVPAQSHVQVSLDAFDAGKHLFIEKPLTLRLDEADLLIERVKNSRLKAMVGFNLRRHRLINQAHQILQKGWLGKLQMIRTALTGIVVMEKGRITECGTHQELLVQGGGYARLYHLRRNTFKSIRSSEKAVVTLSR